MHRWANKKDMAGDDPPYLSVGTEVSAKYKGAFCEAKIRKVVKAVKCKVQYKNDAGSAFVNDDQIKGVLMPGASVEVKPPDKKEYVEGTIVKIQDLSQYTVVFDDGDIATLRRTALCLKSGRHFAEGETLDQLPLTHPEHFSSPVVSGMRGSRRREEMEENSDDESKRERKVEREEDMGKVVCVEVGDKKKSKDNWFPGLIVAPNAQDSVKIDVEDEYLVRSFKDGRYYTVPKKETVEFTREVGAKVDHPTLKMAVEKAISFLDKDDLPPHWDREVLFGMGDYSSDTDGSDSDSTDDEPREEKDHFVAQLYKFMDDRGTPINKGPMISSKDVDLYKLFKIVNKLGGYNRVTNRNQWKSVAMKLGYNSSQTNNVKTSYKKYLHNFEDFYRKLGCTLLSSANTKLRSRSSRPLIRDRDKTLPEKLASEKDENHSSDETPDGGLGVVVGGGSSSTGTNGGKLDNQTPKEENDVTEGSKQSKDITSIPKLTKDNLKLKAVRDHSTESRGSAKDDEKPRKGNGGKSSATAIAAATVDVTETSIGSTIESVVAVKDVPSTPTSQVKDKTKSDTVTLSGEKKSERKSMKVQKLPAVVPSTSDDNGVGVTEGTVPKAEKAMSSGKTKVKKLKGGGVEKRKKLDTPLPGVRAKRPTLKERMEEICKQIKLRTGMIYANMDKKKSKATAETDANKGSPQLFKVKSKDEIIGNNGGPKSRKLSVGSNESRSSTSTNGNEKKSAGPVISGNAGPVDAASTSVFGKAKKSDDENGSDGPRKKSGTRKRRDDDKYSSSSSENLINQSIDIVSPHKTICIGDKLKVYYEPEHESKVTYEAKVLNKRHGAVTEYLVHYTGWNTRYDEWVRRSRIADNLSWTPTRDKNKFSHNKSQSSELAPIPQQADQPPSQLNQSNSVKTEVHEKLKRSSISPAGRGRSRSITKSVVRGMKNVARQIKNAENKLTAKFETRGRKAAAVTQKDSESSAESDTESVLNQKQELQKTRSRTEKQKQQDDDYVLPKDKEVEVRKKKLAPLKRTRSGSLKLEPKEQEPAKKRKITPVKGAKGPGRGAAPNSMLKTLMPRKRTVDKTKKLFKDEQELANDKIRDAKVKEEELDEEEEDEDEFEDIAPKKEPRDETTLTMKQNNSTLLTVDGVMESISIKRNAIELDVLDEAELVLKLKPFQVHSANDEEEETKMSEALKEKVAAIIGVTKEEMTPPVLKKEIVSDEEISVAASTTLGTTNQLLADSYLSENVDKLKVVKAKKKEAEEKTTSPGKIFSRGATDKLLGKANCDIKEKTFFTSRNDKNVEVKKYDVSDKEKKGEAKLRNVTMFSSYLSMDKIDSIRKAAHLEKMNATAAPAAVATAAVEKTADKTASTSQKGSELGSKCEDDIYEFKEPEPFEFRGIDDRTILHRRPQARIFDDGVPYKRSKVGASADEDASRSSDDVDVKSASNAASSEYVEKADIYVVENPDESSVESNKSISKTKDEEEEPEEELATESGSEEQVSQKTTASFEDAEDSDKFDTTAEDASFYDARDDSEEDDEDEEEEEDDDMDESKLVISESDQSSENILGDVEKNAAPLITVVEKVHECKPFADDRETEKGQKRAVITQDDTDSDKEGSSSNEKDAKKSHKPDSIVGTSKTMGHDARDRVIRYETSANPKSKYPAPQKEKANEDTSDEETSSSKSTTDTDSDIAKTIIEHAGIIGEIEIETSTTAKKAAESNTTDVKKKESEWENKKMASAEDEQKAKEEEEHDGLLLCAETIPKSPESKDMSQDTAETSYPSSSTGHEETKKMPEKQGQKVKKGSQHAFPAPGTVFENTPPTTPEGSTPGTSPSDERSGFSSNMFSLNEKSGSNKDSSENDTYSDNSEKSMKVKKHRDESGTYSKKSTYEFDSYLKRKMDKENCKEEPHKKKSKHGTTSANESEKDEFSDGGSSPKTIPLPPKFTKSSYYLDLDPDLDTNQRIEILEQKVQELRKTYMALKQELLSIDKRRKKLRRREREGIATATHSNRENDDTKRGELFVITRRQNSLRDGVQFPSF